MRIILDWVQIILLILFFVIIVPLAILEMMILFIIGFKIKHLGTEDAKAFSLENSLFYKIINSLGDSQ